MSVFSVCYNDITEEKEEKEEKEEGIKTTEQRYYANAPSYGGNCPFYMKKTF